MRCSGFILIEFLIALFIASALSVSMMSSLTMMQKTNAVVDGYIDVYGGTGRLQQQLERDLSGLVVPLSFFETATAMAATSTQPGSQASAQPAAKGQKNNYAFYATKKEKMTNLLTFVTTNPLASFWSDKAGQAKSRIARVVYRLVPDKEHQKFFHLMRQEGMELDFKKYSTEAKTFRPLEIARNIKSFSMQFMVETERPHDKDSDKQKTVVTYKTFDEWNADEQKGDEKNKEKKLKVPRFVKVMLVVADERGAREDTFDYTFPILCEVDVEMPKRPEPATPPQTPGLPPIKKGGFREKLASLSGKPTTQPGGLLGQFTQQLKGIA